jgi:polyferredoxin
MARDNDNELGWKFWLGIVAFAIAAGLAVLITMLIIGRVWYAWGFFGMFLALAAVALVAGYIVDKRDARKRRGIEA